MTSLHIPDFSTLNVIVIGDVMLDRYWQGRVSRISPEAPVPVVNINSDKMRPGGAANVAMCLSALGCNVSLYGVVGKDKSADILLQRLNTAGINSKLHVDDTFITITKWRVIDELRHQQLIRLDFDPTPGQNCKASDLSSLYENYREQIAQGRVHAVILSDYAKNTVLQNPKLFIEPARKANVPVFVDPKRVDLLAYRGATVLTPNAQEYTAAVGQCNENVDFINKGLNTVSSCELEALLVTCGSKGMILIQKGDSSLLQFPAHAREVFDVTGAGDMVIAMLAAGYAARLSLVDAVALANLAAGLVVKKLGAATLAVTELHHALREEQGLRQDGILTEDALPEVLKEIRAYDRRIVFTNGCFDILHPGHIAYLTQARALGDYLIVGVNDDASVARLKGTKRPITPLADRLSVLSALHVVDWVVPFSEDTPERLIEAIAPNVLVKGGDYTPDTIVGADFVKRYGGEVHVLTYLPDYSTTKILEKL